MPTVIVPIDLLIMGVILSIVVGALIGIWLADGYDSLFGDL